MKVVVPMVVVGSGLVASVPAASAAVCSDSTPQYCPAPVVTTGPAANVTVSSAVMTGTVNPNGAFTTCAFTYGLTSPSSMQTTAQGFVAGTSTITITAPVVGLQAQTSFQYALVCASGGGVGTGSTVAFTTLDHGPSHLQIIGPGSFVSSHRFARLFFSCYGDRSCSGQVTLKVKGHKIGSASYFVSSNSGSTIYVKINSRTFNKLKHHSVGGKVKATQGNGGNTASRSVTLHRYT